MGQKTPNSRHFLMKNFPFSAIPGYPTTLADMLMTTPPNTTIFRSLLINTFVTTLTNSFAWFCLTFWVFTETKSILATSLIAGIFAISNAITALFFGAIVDHNKKKHVMLGSSLLSLTAFIIATTLFFTLPDVAAVSIRSVSLWIFIVILMLGTIVGNLRNIALSTCVSLLFKEDERAKVNGQVGTVNGVSFLCTSLFSGLVIGYFSMSTALWLVIGFTLLAVIHLAFVSFPEKEPAPSTKTHFEKIDMRGTLNAIHLIPGLLALIFFTTFNNFLGGVFMALMDSYGLSLVSVQTWGILWSGLSTGFIVSGILIAKKGLGKNPVKTLFFLNTITWTSCIFFTIQPSIVLLVIGTYIWMLLMPAIEASEQTILQNVIPLERQGRVFGFAQSIESAATPITAFLIGPLTHFVFVPFMTSGEGYGANLIGSWFGTGQDRAIAVVFTLAGLIGLMVTLMAKHSQAAKNLSARYLEAVKQNVQPAK